MAACPKGHESATLDYCDVCGTLMGGASEQPAASAALQQTPSSPGPKTCPLCGTPQSGGRFCEEDGYDFLLAPPVSPAPAAAPATTAPPAEVPAPSETTAQGWTVVVRADPAYFEIVKAMDGEGAGSLEFPRFAPERCFVLCGEQVVIGRRSRSRGVNPDIDLGGPFEDPGVSHLHALLVSRQDGWAVVDLQSANGTYLKDPSSNPIDPNLPVPVKNGDKIYLGAWTTLTVRAA